MTINIGCYTAFLQILGSHIRLVTVGHVGGVIIADLVPEILVFLSPPRIGVISDYLRGDKVGPLN